MKFLLELNHMESEGLIEAVLAKFVTDAENEIDTLPERRNINWAAVDATDALRGLWWRNTGKEGPFRALNPASKFASFLRDGFLFLDIDADPISAFKRWVALDKEWPAEAEILEELAQREKSHSSH